MICWKVAIRADPVGSVSLIARSFSVWRPFQEKPLPPRQVIAETDLLESFLKGSGPGGQKINKTSSAVQLKHIPTGLVVKSQATRSRDQNRKIARRLLADRLEEIEKGNESRTALKAEEAKKKKASATKKTRRKYKRLDEGSAPTSDGVEEYEGDAADVHGNSNPPSVSEDMNETQEGGSSSITDGKHNRKP